MIYVNNKEIYPTEKNKKIKIYVDEIEFDIDKGLRDFIDDLEGYEEDLDFFHTEED